MPCERLWWKGLSSLEGHTYSGRFECMWFWQWPWRLCHNANGNPSQSREYAPESHSPGWTVLRWGTWCGAASLSIAQPMTLSAHDTLSPWHSLHRFAPILSRLLVHLLQDHAHPILLKHLVSGWSCAISMASPFTPHRANHLDSLESRPVLTLIAGPISLRLLIGFFGMFSFLCQAMWLHRLWRRNHCLKKTVDAPLETLDQRDFVKQ